MRPDFKIILDWIPEKSTVIDLGCGDGSLLELLANESAGMDKSQVCVDACEKKSLTAVRRRIDEEKSYRWLGDKVYDYAICSVTLQMVEYPDVLLSQMKRISKRQIISFPNFAKWNNRLELLFKGRMPKWMLCGYEWYNTGHIHQLSIKDFISYVGKDRILGKRFLPRRPLPNLLAHTAIYLCEL